MMGRRRRKKKQREPLLETDHADYARPSCTHFGTCGGCRWQDHTYGAQLRRLANTLSDDVEPILMHLPELDSVIPAPSPYAYRNKMDFTFAKRRWVESHEPEDVFKDFGLGLHVPGRFDKVLDVQECSIAFPEAARILSTVRSWALENEVTPWDVYAHVGLLRHLVLRKSMSRGDIMAQLVTTHEERSIVDPLFDLLTHEHPEVTTAVQTLNGGVAMIATGEEERVVFGDGVIRESVLDREFVISPRSFFQTNTEQASRLAEVVIEEIGEGSIETLYDVCCGGGFFSVLLSSRVAHVFGFELVPSAIEDARRNALNNGILNARFVEGDVIETMTEASLASLGAMKPDVCIVDPPRAGLHEKVCRAIINLKPSRVIYVSCQPKMAVGNLEDFIESGYRIERVRPIDLFPQTPHLECVFTLVKTDPTNV